MKLILLILLFGNFAEGKYRKIFPKGSLIAYEVLSDKEAQSLPVCKELLRVFNAKYCPASIKKVMSSRLVSKNEIARWQRENRGKILSYDYTDLKNEAKVVASFKYLWIKALNKFPYVFFQVRFDTLRLGFYESGRKAFGNGEAYYLPLQLIILKHKLNHDLKLRDNLRKYRKNLLEENNSKGVLT